MATSKRKRSSLKRIRQTIRRAARNRTRRGMLRTVVKRARGATADAAEELREAQSALDRAVARGAIPKNQGARRMGRLAKAVAKNKSA